ncbi:proteasome-domain-containing protein [Neoconidiobolus thromboides FSU 785]|nr:proteasome-domain-containing protein [Neoconidiobolus thromboides FSU 785]
MEVVVGLVGKDFTICGGDTTVIRSITVLKSTEPKSRILNKHNAIYFTGESGDTVQFAEFIQKNVQLFHFTNNGEDLTTPQVASFTRRQLAESLRSRNPYQVNSLISGWSKKDGPKLYWLDYLASSESVKFASHGYGAFYLMSLLDRYYKPDMELEEAKEVIKKCLLELKTRFIINFSNFKFDVADANGIREIEIPLSS